MGVTRFFTKPAAMAALCLLFSTAAQAQTRWYVDDDAPADPGPGDPRVSNPNENGSIDAPFDAIQDAIDAAAHTDEVLVAEGTYRGTGNRNLNFRGKAITVRGSGGPQSCVIDCEGFSRGVTFRSGETASSVLEGLTIRRAIATGFFNSGAGINCENSSPTIRDCIITGCVAELGQSAGAGILCVNSHPRIERTHIVGNSSIGSLAQGGGVSLFSSHPTFVDSVIADNQSDFAGGGMLLNNSRPMLLRTVIQGNAAEYGGGVVCQAQSRPVLQSCILRGNMANYASGMQCNDCNPEIRDSLIVGNMSFVPGNGAIDNYSNAETRIDRCTIADNTFIGVGCYSPASTVRIHNCILHNNDQDLHNCTASYSLTTFKNPGDGNISGDPLFVGPDDYRLSPDSPCVDGGDPDYVPASGDADLDGHARVLCGALDMGAYELGIGDFDCNDTFDRMDFQGWPGCETGPDSPGLNMGCSAFDFDANHAVDLADFASFANNIP